MQQDRLKIMKGGLGPDTMLARQVVLNCGAFHGRVKEGAASGLEAGLPLHVSRAGQAGGPAKRRSSAPPCTGGGVGENPIGWTAAAWQQQGRPPRRPLRTHPPPKQPATPDAPHRAAAPRRYGQGCDGGDVIDVVRYMKHYGLPDESCMVSRALRGRGPARRAAGPECQPPGLCGSSSRGARRPRPRP